MATRSSMGPRSKGLRSRGPSNRRRDRWRRVAARGEARLTARRASGTSSNPASMRASWSAAARRAADEADIEWRRRLYPGRGRRGVGPRCADYRAQKPPDTTTTGFTSFGAHARDRVQLVRPAGRLKNPVDIVADVEPAERLHERGIGAVAVGDAGAEIDVGGSPGCSRIHACANVTRPQPCPWARLETCAPPRRRTSSTRRATCFSDAR